MTRRRPALASPSPSSGPVAGQRYASDAEPELGLGLVIGVDGKNIELVFPAADEARRYVLGSAPIRRVRFGTGDVLGDDEGRTHRVQSVEEHGGVLVYRTDHGSLPESRVAARTAVTGPRERLLAGTVDPQRAFALRSETRTRLHQMRRSPVRGLVGPRIELLPHQFYVASEVSSRLVPRVLLADETGLGKTIEAGLILSRLLLSGRASRVLVLVPDALLHQWLVELRRRFQLRFAIFKEVRCRALEDSFPGENPFAQEQLVLATQSLLVANPTRGLQAADAGWDLVVVDEAHHLQWSHGSPSPEYAAVEAVARRSEGLLLLTATPEQLGAEGHFARLRLLDPDRYGDFDRWQREAKGFREAARLASLLLGAAGDGQGAGDAASSAKVEGSRAKRAKDADAGKAGTRRKKDGTDGAAANALDAADLEALAKVLRPHGGAAATQELAAAAADADGRAALLAELLDRHGPGRVMFRNTRTAVRGLPQRSVFAHPLEAPPGPAGAAVRSATAREVLDDLAARPLDDEDEAGIAEAAGDANASGASAESIPGGNAAGAAAGATPETLNLRGDPRVDWLVRFLGPKGPRKVLLLCRTRAKAEALEAALADRLRVATVLFHEGLKPVQRDRNAAWFAEPDGARLMICSELGSEGRNFQHARHLVLFDLPLDPDLVEQRIGRLDRIGQKGTVEIHVPYLAGSGAEVVLRWMHEGVGALETPSLASHPLLQSFGARVRELAAAAEGMDAAALRRAVDDLVAATAEESRALAERVEKGRDRLLELASLRREVADPLLAAVRAVDADPAFEEWFLKLLEHFHLYAEEIQPRCYQLNPDGRQSLEFPGLDEGQAALTFDRDIALVREDLVFATPDHPLLGDATEALLASPSGNAAFALQPCDAAPRLWLEAFWVLEPVAPPRLHADRFLAPTPLRVLLDQHLRAAAPDEDPTEAALEDGRGDWIASNQAVLAPLLEKMRAKAEELAEAAAADARNRALETMHRTLEAEARRVEELAKTNNHVDPAELDMLAGQRKALAAAIGEARLRPDALRLVWQGPVRNGAPLATKGKG